MNINKGVMALNINDVLVKRQLNKDHEEKSERAALKINEEAENKGVEYNPERIETIDENLVAAKSNIENIDKVEDLLKRTKDSILQESAMALLSQAKKRSSDVMTLLQ